MSKIRTADEGVTLLTDNKIINVKNINIPLWSFDCKRGAPLQGRQSSELVLKFHSWFWMCKIQKSLPKLLVRPVCVPCIQSTSGQTSATRLFLRYSSSIPSAWPQNGHLPRTEKKRKKSNPIRHLCKRTKTRYVNVGNNVFSAYPSSCKNCFCSFLHWHSSSCILTKSGRNSGGYRTGVEECQTRRHSRWCMRMRHFHERTLFDNRSVSQPSDKY